MPRGAAPGERRGGRQKGTPNRASIARQEQVAASGMTPMEFMLHMMRGDYAALGVEKEEITLPLRNDAAKNVAPYVHPKLHAIEHKQRTAESEGEPAFTWLPPT